MTTRLVLFVIGLATLGSTQAEAGQQPAGQIVKLYFVAINDNGRSGTRFGCNDSLVEVTRDIGETDEPLMVALATLLSVRSVRYGESGLYNTLGQSTLRVDEVIIDDEGTAQVGLLGSLALAGTCDGPRALAQLRSVALQFPEVKAVKIFVNHIPIEELVGGR